MAAAEGAIQIVPQASMWISLLLFAQWRKLSIDIDGRPGRFSWGTHTFTVAPGEHVVGVGGASYGMKASLTVQVAAHQTVVVRYSLSFRRGRLDVEHVASARLIR